MSNTYTDTNQELLEEQQPTIFGLRRIAIIEVAVFFVIAFLIDMQVTSGGARFIDVTPHPYWIIVLLISAQYGSHEGLFAVLAASLALLVGNLPESNTADQDFYQWLTAVFGRPVMWLVAAVVIGELTARHARRIERLRDMLHTSREHERTFRLSYEKVRARKERLERDITNRIRTETGAFRAAKAIEKLNPDEVYRGVSEMASSALGAEKFSLYLLNDDALACHLTEGWSDADGQRFDTTFRVHQGLYQAIVTRRETLCILNEDHERALGSQGVLAGPLLNTESGEVIGMLKVEAIDFLELNLETVESFRAICEWVTLAISHARYYQNAVNDTTVNPEHNLMTKGFFHRYKDYITALAQRLKFNVYMLNVDVVNHSTLNADDSIKVARLLSSVVADTLRTVDFAFDHQQKGGHYSIILPATDERGAQIVQDKIEKALKQATHVRGARYAFTLAALHDKG